MSTMADALAAAATAVSGGALIHADDLWRTYVMGAEEIHALRGVSFEIQKGEYVAVMGPSGLRQVDAHEHHRLPGHAHRRAATSCTATSSPR